MTARLNIIRVLITLVFLVLVCKLSYLQIVSNDYKLAAEKLFVKKKIEEPYRGNISDRNGHLIVGNQPIFDVEIIPRDINLKDSLLIRELFSLNQKEFTSKYNKAYKYSKFKASPFVKDLSVEDFAHIQDQLSMVSGLKVKVKSNRLHFGNNMGSTLGYVAEISSDRLKKDTSKYYRAGDLVGFSGLERQYEHFLRGHRGISHKIYNALGQVQGNFANGKNDLPPTPGMNVQLTIDYTIQSYAEHLMKGKRGSLVAIEPKSGEILLFLSVPNYDPSLLVGKKFSSNYKTIVNDNDKPLFNRPIQATYPPGSMFKTIQSLIALQEGVIAENEKIYSDLSLIGDLAPAGYYDVKKAITFSSNNYFYKVFKRIVIQNKEENPFLESRIGLEKWGKYLLRFGLGETLGIDLPGERKGMVPSVAKYDRIYGINRWKYSNIASLSIGQGELLVTPLQMANLGAILANRGYYFTPHLVRSIEDETINGKHHEVGIDSIHYLSVIEGMENVVKNGSGFRASVQGLNICGKTSTVQNPPNPDHSGFMGFAPKENPKIAIAVYVENAGQGGRSAAGIAGLVIEKYLTGKISRPWMQEYILRGEFLDER